MHVCMSCVCVCASQPNFRISPLIGRMHLWMQFNAVRASHMHVWSIPSRSRFINLMPFRFHFVCAQIHFFGAKSLSEIWNRFDSHKESIKIMQFRLISQLCRASINAAFCTHEQYRIVNSTSNVIYLPPQNQMKNARNIYIIYNVVCIIWICIQSAWKLKLSCEKKSAFYFCKMPWTKFNWNWAKMKEHLNWFFLYCSVH